MTSSVLPLLSIAYAPPIAYFSLLCRGEVLIEASESFQKQSFRNRCRILTPQGVEELTIPVLGGSLSSPIRQVAIASHDNWRQKHLEAIKSAYGKTPFYEFYIDDIRPIYEDDKLVRLFDFNLALIERLASLLHIPFSYSLTTTYQPIGSYLGEDYRTVFHPKRSLEASLFTTSSYYHRFPIRGEMPSGVSIYDLLFNMGPESILVLQ